MDESVYFRICVNKKINLILPEDISEVRVASACDLDLWKTMITKIFGYSLLDRVVNIYFVNGRVLFWLINQEKL